MRTLGKMTMGDAWMIFKDIQSPHFSRQEKLEAARIVANAETLNSIKKDELKEGLRYVLEEEEHVGTWIDEDGAGDTAVCSCCGEVYDTSFGSDESTGFELFCECYKFCPNCGDKKRRGT